MRTLPHASDEAAGVARQLARPRRLHLAALVAILALATVLQLYDLGAKSLWDDEVRAVQIASAPTLTATIAEFQSTERQPPLHYLLLHGWVRLAGTSEALLRLPSALFAVGSFAAIAWLGWRLGGAPLGLAAGFVLALSPFLVLYGRMVRYYSLALCCATLSLALFVELLERQRQARPAWLLWGAYALMTVSMLLSSYLALAVLAVEGLWLLLVVRDARGPAGKGRSVGRLLLPWAVALVVVLAVFGGWLAFEAGRIPSFQWAAPGGAGAAARAIVFQIAYPLYAYTLGATIFPWHPLALIGLCLVAVFVFAGIRASGTMRRPFWLAVSGAAICLAAGVAAFRTVTQDLGFNELPSRAIVALPFFSLLLAAGALALPRRWRTVALAGWAAVSVAGLVNYFTNQQFIDPTPAVPTRELVADVLAESGPNDLILAQRDWVITHYYEISHAPPGGKPQLLPIQQAGTVRDDLERGRFDRVWWVRFHDFTAQNAPPDLDDWLARSYRLERTMGYLPQDGFYLRLRRLVQTEDRPTNRVDVEVYGRTR